MKDSFVFRREWRDAISGLPDEVRLEVYEAIIEYGTLGTLPSGLKQLAGLAFNFAKAALDRDIERYEEVRKKRSEAGRQHKGNQYTQNGTSVPKMEQMEQNGTNGTDNVNVNVNDIKEEPPKGGKKKGTLSSSSPKVLMQERKVKFIESLDTYTDAYGKEMIEAFISYWTEPNKSLTKMRYELERTWDTERRLATWAKNEAQFCVDKSKTKHAKQDETARVAREESERKTEELLKKRDEWTRQSVSHAEAMNSEEYRKAIAEA